MITCIGSIESRTITNQHCTIFCNDIIAIYSKLSLKNTMIVYAFLFRVCQTSNSIKYVE